MLLTKDRGFFGGSHSGLACGGLTTLIIGQSLTFDALKRFVYALVVPDAKLGTISKKQIQPGPMQLNLLLSLGASIPRAGICFAQEQIRASSAAQRF